MCRKTGPNHLSLPRRRGGGLLAALLFCCLAGHPTQAQDWMGGASPLSGLNSPMSASPLSPWAGLGSSMSPSGIPSMSQVPGAPFGGRMAAPSDFNAAYGGQPRITWQTPYAMGQDAPARGAPADSHQPDLTGIWRGSGGETVEVQRNRARIWSGNSSPCNCVFFLVGQRLIAYSPDTDQVRKYWYLGGTDQFSLIDEAGNLMNFRRTR